MLSTWFSGGAAALIFLRMDPTGPFPATFRAEGAFLVVASIMWILAVTVSTGGMRTQTSLLRRTSLQEEAATAEARRRRQRGRTTEEGGSLGHPGEGPVHPGDYERERVT